MSDVIPGGLSPTKPAEAKIQAICDEMKPEVEKQLGKTFKDFIARSYRSQVVAGMNYFIKVDVGDNTYAHIQVWEKLPCEGGAHILSGVQYPMKKDDPIEYFPREH